MAVQALPQKERRQVITETEKTVTKAEKEKETKAKRGKKPKEKAARRDKTAGNTVLALKNNLLYDLALAPNIEIEIPVGKRWSVNLEYKSPWWSNSSKELIYYIEKLDINEEKQRLSNHLRYFRETMAGGHGQGKKLGFIAQEMGREINTTGSKSNHAEMQNIVVQMKDELEQIKEQVLNVM